MTAKRYFVLFQLFTFVFSVDKISDGENENEKESDNDDQNDPKSKRTGNTLRTFQIVVASSILG